MPTWLTALLPFLLQAIEGLVAEAQASNAANNHPKTAEVLGIIGQITALVAPHVVKGPVATIGGGQGAPITPPNP
jgi:hypothetical protein